MEGIRTAASIIAVIQLTSDAIKYVNKAAGATQERKRLREELRSCEEMLQQLKDEVDDAKEPGTPQQKGALWSDKITALEAAGAPLSRLTIAIDTIQSKLNPKKEKGLKKILTKLTWPFTVAEVDKMIGMIEREKSLLSIALTNNSRELIEKLHKASQENELQLRKLISLVNRNTEEAAFQFQDLKDHIVRVQTSQAYLVKEMYANQGEREAASKRKNILDWLSPDNAAAQQLNFMRRREEGTGEWFINSEEYQTWIEGKGQILFCPGIPGAGKTMISSLCVEYLRQKFQTDENVAIAFVYCDFRRKKEQTPAGLFASLLKQLVMSAPTLPDDLISLYEEYEQTQALPSLEEVLDCLESFVANYSHLYLVVDALDECETEDGSRSEFLSHLFHLHKRQGVNIMATSRFITEIEERFKGTPSLEIRAHERDIRKLIETFIPRLPSFVASDPELQEEIKLYVTDAVDGMFLLAQLHLNSLVGKRSAKAIRTAIMNMKGGSGAYHDAYHSTMQRIESQVQDRVELAKEALRWVSFSWRPMTIVELQTALAIETGTNSLAEDNVPCIEDIVSACDGLLVIDNDSNMVRLAHYTAHEYFSQTKNEWFPDVDSATLSACISYLSFDEFKTGPCKMLPEYEERVASYPFFLYAAHTWWNFVDSPLREAILFEFIQSLPMAEAICQAVVIDGLIFLESLHRIGIGKFTSIHLAADFGVPELALKVIELGADIESVDRFESTALSLSCTSGAYEVAELLVLRGARTETQNRRGYAPLLYAARQGFVSIMNLLLENGAHAELATRDGRTALALASEFGHSAAVQLLLDQDVDPNTNDYYARTPINNAALKGHSDVVEMLLAKDASTKIRDYRGRTCLANAARGGYLSCVTLLADAGAHYDAKDKYGLTPLCLASMEGHLTVVEYLLGRSANVEQKASNGWTPLVLACWAGHIEVAETLLANGAQVRSDVRPVPPPDKGDLKDIVYEDNVRAPTPLGASIASGALDMVKLLFANGADIKEKDLDQGTLLHWAISLQQKATMVQLLLEYGSDPESRDSEGRRALELAKEVQFEDDSLEQERILELLSKVSLANA